MNTIIEQIKAEVERLKKEHQEPTIRGDEYEEGGINGYHIALDKVLAKLDTIKEQPVDASEDERIRQGLISYLKADMEYNPSQSPPFYTEALAYLGRQSKPTNAEGLEEEIYNYANTIAEGTPLFEIIPQTARHFAQWGAEHLATPAK